VLTDFSNASSFGVAKFGKYGICAQVANLSILLAFNLDLKASMTSFVSSFACHDLGLLVNI
jgi:hypothetical protein